MQLLLLSRKNCSPDTVIMKFSDPVLRRLTINMTNITKLTLEEKKKTYPVPPWTWGPSPRKKEFHLYLPKQVKSAGQRLMISLVVYPSLYLELKILHNQIHDKKSKKKKTGKITFVSSNEDYESICTFKNIINPIMLKTPKYRICSEEIQLRNGQLWKISNTEGKVHKFYF